MPVDIRGFSLKPLLVGFVLGLCFGAAALASSLMGVFHAGRLLARDYRPHGERVSSIIFSG